MAKWPESSVKILESRYLLKDKKGEVIETPDAMLERVARHVALAEIESDRDKWFEEYMGILDSLEFLPNSPTLMNAGTEMGQLSGCFLIPCEDNLSAIMEAVKQTAIVHKSGGGTGLVFSRIRPSGSIVNTTAGVASGPVSFMKIFDTTTGVIKQGGKRRGANIGILSCSHPDILNFIKCKEDPTQFQNFNISISITDNFMKAVAADNGYPLINPYTKDRVYVKAKEIFHTLCEQAWKTGEPGVVFIDTINRANPVPEFGRIEGTNPCLSGNTLIAVADGRNAVTIKRLAEEGKDFAVYSQDLKAAGKGNMKVVVKRAYNPRKTRENAEIYKIVLDDGSSLKTTADHLFMVRDGKWKMAKDLKPNDSLMPFNTIIDNGYVTVNSNGRYWKRQFRMIWEFNNGISQPKGYHIHHKDFHKSNDFPENLELITIEEHKNMHNISGDKNPMRRFPEKNWRNNPIKQQEMREKHHVGAKRSSETCERISKSLKGNESLKRPLSDRSHNFEFCNCAICKNKRNSLEKVLHNHKVISVEYFGVEDVYNFEVEENHNFMVITNYRSDKSSTGVCVHNCGEVPLLFYESCNLGSIDLSKMVKNKKIDWNRLNSVVEVAVRFLDDIIDVNRYPNVKIARKTRMARKIGLGVMGWADLLIELGLRYDSNEALDLAGRVMRAISETSHQASKSIGEEKGFCTEKLKRRNATTTVVAPTGTLSLLAGCSSSIEPIFAKEYTKTIMDGVCLDLSKHKNVSDEVLVTSHEVSVEKHIAMQAAFQQHTDGAVSKTINLPKTAKIASVHNAFTLAHSLGCKGLTVYRDGSRESAPMKETEDVLSECEGNRCSI